MLDTIKNCVATGGTDAKVLKQHVVSETDPLFSEYNGYHTGMDLKSLKAYSPIPGDVLYIGEDESSKCIIMQFDSGTCVMYKNMNSIVVKEGQTIEVGQLLGSCFNYLHVDLLRLEESMWPVRVRGRTYFKHNPESLLVDGYESLKASLTYLYDPISPLIESMFHEDGGAAM